ncbi:hypothetical protein FRB91_007492 [Serendipita sp. 411]|nr:hypothetical protein FRC15_003463 [Serendipita sp. 397]KAG8838423.1 hypothetical protein FRC18_004703 [Serendipita sp. 400]KAG8859606.1 hypothetical protein FRB91_007492 [Serendipita sp. 411]KAG9056653.1 hypothetical protein FS842_009955 [Serendipita sp. 407]
MNSRMPRPGSASFVSELSSQVESQLNSSVPYDENVFKWILYCLVTGDKHLILRTKTRDCPTVVRIAKSVLYTVFGMNTVTLKLTEKSTNDSLMQAMFPSLFQVLQGNISPTSSLPPTAAAVQPLSSIPPSSYDRRGRIAQTAHLMMTPSGARSSSYVRSHTQMSLQDRLSHVADTLLPPAPGKARLSTAATVTGFTDDDHGSIRGVRPISGRVFLHGDHDAASVIALTATHHLVQPSFSQNSAFQFPQACIVHGLETAPKHVQETLWDILRTRSCSFNREGDEEHGLVANMPEGFILVYVCPLGDGSSNPPLMKALLDRFSFNASVIIPPSPNSSQIFDPPRSPLLRRNLLLTREYIEQLHELVQSAHINHTVSMYISNVLSSIRFHPQLDASNVTTRCARDVSEFTKTVFVLSGATTRPKEDVTGIVELHADNQEDMPEGQRAALMTTEDVKRIIRNVVGHRITVREGVHEELLGSLVCTAVQKSQMKARAPTRTIRDIMNEAIAAV